MLFALNWLIPSTERCCGLIQPRAMVCPAILTTTLPIRRSARSRVWALGLRNPFRMGLQPNTGSHFPPDGNPGVLYVGNVGWNTWEALDVVPGPKQNFGWPTYEGLSRHPALYGNDYNVIPNQDAPNPLYPGAGCSQYFSFRQLLHEDTLNPAGQPPFEQSLQRFADDPEFHPAVSPHPASAGLESWQRNHTDTDLRRLGSGADANVGAPGSPVSGTPFAGNCAIGGTWYTGTNFPAAYQNLYYFADWGQGLIKTLSFDANNKPVALGNFASNAGAVVSIVQHPIDGSLYYISYDYTGGAVTATFLYRQSDAGRSCLRGSILWLHAADGAVEQQWFVRSGRAADHLLVELWRRFAGEHAGQPGTHLHRTARRADEYVVTLTVTDSGQFVGANDIDRVGKQHAAERDDHQPGGWHALFAVQPNHSQPDRDGQRHRVERCPTVLSMAGVPASQRSQPSHPGRYQSSTTAVIEPTGCDGINIYYYRIILTVTDPAGLATTQEVRLFPDCGPNTPPTISSIPDQTIVQNSSTGPIPFTVGDAETPAANLQLSAASSNPGLIPNQNIVFGGTAPTAR